MKTRVERTITPQGAVETGFVTVHGREYAALGAVVTDTRLIGYPGAHGIVHAWDGTPLGTYAITGHASGFRDRTGHRTRLVCYRVRLHDGREYVGRGLGLGMVLKCRRVRGR